MAADPAMTFLVRVLPWADADGWFNVEWKTAEGRWLRQSFRRVDAMLAAVQRLKSHNDIYVCMSSQAVNGQRLKQNARFRKSLSLDVDVKEGAFPTTAEAGIALGVFLHAVGLPRPTLFVMTAGLTGGFHCHWALDAPVARDEWVKLAKALRNAAKAHGLTVDENVITDTVRLLRVPGTSNFKPEYGEPRPVLLHPSIVERDYPIDEIAGPLTPYMRASLAREGKQARQPAAEQADENAPAMTQSPLFDAFDLGENNQLTGGMINWAEVEDAVLFLSERQWFHRPHYDRARALAWSLGGIEIAGGAPADDVRALHRKVIEATDRDWDKNEQLYEDGIARTRAQLRAGEEIVGLGTIFHWARELGWTGLAPVTAVTAPAQPGVWTLSHEQVALKAAKSKLHSAFVIARILGRHRIKDDLVRVARDRTKPSVRARLMYPLALFLLKSDHTPEEIVGAVIACGFTRDVGVHAVLWAHKNKKGNVP